MLAAAPEVRTATRRLGGKRARAVGEQEGKVDLRRGRRARRKLGKSKIKKMKMRIGGKHEKG